MTHSPAIFFEGQASISGAPLFARLRLEITAGAWTCLLGGSGVGKSTILRLIAGLETGASFDGAITASDGQDVQSRVAYMAQDDLLLPWATAAENVALGARLRGESPDTDRVTRLLERSGLSEHAKKRKVQLSGGQRQRVALARTLMEDKPIILLDEPFSALDAKTRSEMHELAAELLSGRTVLMVTHDPAEAARLGNSIAILAPGGMEHFEPPASAIPRPLDAIETLQCQANLMRTLREPAA
ncbi:MAG: ABC transporter ATP-binding protein [Pseudomonadota bacterium]